LHFKKNRYLEKTQVNKVLQHFLIEELMDEVWEDIAAITSLEAYEELSQGRLIHTYYLCCYIYALTVFSN
jgi:hypothetical protein